MATVSHLATGWFSADPANDLYPGQSHHWSLGWPSVPGSLAATAAFSVTAHPFENYPERALAVESVQFERWPDSYQLVFGVRNVGAAGAVSTYEIHVGLNSQ
jgi:hypothetical protein